jgi:hypothetical protein
MIILISTVFSWIAALLLINERTLTIPRVLGATFVVAAVIQGLHHVIDGPDPMWMVALLISWAVLFVLGVLVPLVRRRLK